mgnify:CR=1 FL=1
MNRCPRCSSSLSSVHRDEVHLLACSGCGGVWMSGATLDRFVEALLTQPEAVQAAEQVAASALFEFEPDPDVIGCSTCRRTMEITRHPSGVELDVCAEHGVWFDRHELPRVVRDPEGLAAVKAAQSHLQPQRVPSPTGLGGEVATDALLVTAHVADSVALSGADLGDVADLAAGGVSVAGGALELLGELGSGAVELVFGVLSMLDPT